VKNIVAFPDTSEKIFPEIVDAPYNQIFEKSIDEKKLTFLKTRDMSDAVIFAFENTDF